MTTIENLVPDQSFAAAVVLAEGVRVAAAPAELGRLVDELAARRALEDFPPAPVKDAVRGLLRRGGFKPTGRNKPASEYLAQAAREGRFPRINNLVDVNNLLSLESGLPISLLDLRAFPGPAWLRRGRPGERYVFNSAGQEIELEGLICVCAGGKEIRPAGTCGTSDTAGAGEGEQGAPLGNAVKDSMAAKLKDDTTAVIGVVYASLDCAPGRELAALAGRFAALLERFGGASSVRTVLLGSGRPDKR
ncbi:MAG: phenylalanine--tRNA ligase beta subunit-related protein [Elusimicrobia bacterium]|nr:phenylalanine--tRNA ligase beta subunit-related protein [Elusimicrobiota bacterium]